MVLRPEGSRTRRRTENVEGNDLNDFPTRRRQRRAPREPSAYRGRGYRNRHLTAGDRNQEYLQEGVPEVAREYLREIGAFNETRVCEVPGCGRIMRTFVRGNANGQVYLHCTNSAVHAYYKRTCTLDSYFYRRKVAFHIQLAVVRDYFRLPVQTSILACRQISQGALTSISRDCALLMSSDYTRHYFGDTPGCHHIQIDESKFGKRKYHNGRRVEGVWVFGLVEAIEVPGFPNQYKQGRLMVCTVPNRTAHTLLPIIYRFCSSLGWLGSLHPRDADNVVGANTYSNLRAYHEGDYFFRQHQVVNHSRFYVTSDNVIGNNTIEAINTNMIEGVWCDMKAKIHKRNYNEKDLPAKLIEYLWRRANKNEIKTGMERCLREVALDGTITNRHQADDDSGIITRGMDGNLPEVQQEYEARARDLARYRTRASGRQYASQADQDRAARGREYESSLHYEENITLPDSDSDSSNDDTEFSFSDSDNDYEDLPVQVEQDIIPSASPLPASPVPVPSSPRSSPPTLGNTSNTEEPSSSRPASRRGRPQGSSNRTNSRGRKRGSNTTSRTSRR